MTCKGICKKYKSVKTNGVGRYASGQSRCQVCEIFINIEGLWCPCCGYRLRKKPRNIKYKSKFRAKNQTGKGIAHSNMQKVDVDCPSSPEDLNK